MIAFTGIGNGIYLLVKVFEEEKDCRYRVESCEFKDMYYIPERNGWIENCQFKELLGKINQLFLNKGISDYGGTEC